jgi:sugar phosphate isomerase/epimerase
MTPPSRPPILASCWTTAGDAAPMRTDERSPFRLEDRIRAAGGAGYTGFGIVRADLLTAREQFGYAALKQMLQDHGIAEVEVEMLNDWYTSGPQRESSDIARRDLLEAAEALGARQIKIGGDISGTPVAWDAFVTEFAILCGQVAEHGTRVAFEPMPFGNVADLVTGRRLIDEAGHRSGGLILDLYHMARGGVSNDEIASLPSRYLFAVELCDADRQVVGTLLEDTIDRRRLCGEGDQDLTGFISSVRAAGFDGPWGVEILSQEFRLLELHSQVTRSFETTSTVLRSALEPEEETATTAG